MAATILLKRTKGTSPPTVAPVGTGVSFGELVYTYDITNVGAGKSYKKLYIGHPDGNTNAPIAIGGEYYTDMLPGNPADFGKPVGSRAVILNPLGQINTWSVATDLLVGAAATVSGDLSVAGNLAVTGDLTYDEVNARNWNITGVATAPNLYVTDITDTLNLQSKVGIISALAGVGGTFNDFNSTSAQFEQINVSHASTTNNLTITGISTIEKNYDFRTQLIRIGKEAGWQETDGSDRQGFFIGNYAGTNAGLSTLTKRNVAIGHSAFQKGGQTKSESSIFLGNFAGQEAEGSHNIYIGDKSGQDLGSQTLIGYGETGTATAISFSDASTLPTDPYDYKVYGSIEAAGITSVTGGMWAIAIEDLNDLSVVNNAVNNNLTFNVGTASQGHLGKTKAGPFKVKGSNDFALLTDNNDCIYLDSSSSGYLGLSGQYGFLLITSGITTNSGLEDHDQNIGIGREALWGAGISTNQSNNIAIGAFALYKVYGDNNIAIGQSAGVENTGSNNVIIGKDQDVRYPDQDDQLIIGSGDVKWVSGDKEGWVGIGTTTPTALLDVDGDVNITGVGTVPQLDVNDLGIEAAYITAGIITSQVGTYATITVFDTETADLNDIKVTTGLVTSLVGTYATITDVHITNDLRVGGASTFVGNVTFKGGVIGLGDSTSDAIVFNADIDSSFIPDDDDTYNIGSASQQWKDIHIDGVAYIDDLSVDSTVGTYATITVFDTETADLRDVKITAGIVTDIVGTANTTTNVDFVNADIEDVKITAGLATDFAITNLVNSVGIITNAYIDVGIVTSLVSTASTINTLDVQEGDIVNAKITAGVVTSLVGTYATITVFDTETADLNDIKVTTGIITSLVGTYATITDVRVVDDFRVGGSSTVTGNLEIGGNLVVQGTTTTIESTTVQVQDKHLELGVTTATTPTDTTADGGGLILKGDTDHSLLWDNARDSWKVTEDFSPSADGVKDLGQTDLEWQDLYIDGTAHLDSADILDAKITAGVITSFVGTYATITTAHINTLSADTLSFVGLAVTDVQVSMAATFTGVIDVNNADIKFAYITAGIITSQVGTYSTIAVSEVETLDSDYINNTGVITAHNYVGEGGDLTLGTPTTGSFRGGAVGLTTISAVDNSIEELNFILGKLVPPSPTNIDGAAFTLTGTAGNGRLCDGFTPTNNTGGAAPVAGTQYTRNTDSTVTSNYITEYGPGDSGSVEGWVNAVGVGTTALNVSFGVAAVKSDIGTYGALQIANDKDAYESTRDVGITSLFYEVYDSRLIDAASPDGYNKAHISQLGNNTADVFWYEDASTVSAPVISFGPVTYPSSPTYSYSSGIPHYTQSTDNNFTYVMTVTNASGEMYTQNTFVTDDGQTSAFASPGDKDYTDFAGGTNPPAKDFGVGTGVTCLITNTPRNLHATVTTNIFTRYDVSTPYGSHNNQRIGFTTDFNIMGTSADYTNNVDEDAIECTVGSLTGGSAIRVKAGATGDNPTPAYASWTGNAAGSIDTYEAAVRGGDLRHDQTNYSTGYLPVGPDYSSHDANQYFQYQFIQSGISEFRISYTGSLTGCWVCMPDNSTWTTSLSGTNGWADMFQAYKGSGVPTTAEPGCSSGGLMDTNGGTFTCTFGTESSSNDSNNRVLIRFKLTSGNSTSDISLSDT